MKYLAVVFLAVTFLSCKDNPVVPDAGGEAGNAHAEFLIKSYSEYISTAAAAGCPACGRDEEKHPGYTFLLPKVKQGESGTDGFIVVNVCTCGTDYEPGGNKAAGSLRGFVEWLGAK